MRTFEGNPDADPDADVARQPPSVLQKLFRAGAGLVIAASFGVWAYAYSGFANREAPDVLADQALVTQAEDLCATAVDDVAALPNALEAADGAERAAQIRASTDRFERMVDDLEALRIVNDRDGRIYRSWLSDWRVLLEDRRLRGAYLGRPQRPVLHHRHRRQRAARPASDQVRQHQPDGVVRRTHRRVSRTAAGGSPPP